MKLHIMTWNIRGEASLGWDNRYEIKSKLVDKIIEEKADVVVLTAFVVVKGTDYLLKQLESHKYIWFQVSRTGKNGILIAIKKELVVCDEKLSDKLFYGDVVSSEFEGCNILKVTLPLKCKMMLSIIGCRMETGHKKDWTEQYDFQRKCFEELLIPEIDKSKNSDICILCGDFNNAKHYGRLEETFKHVEQEYWRNSWDEKNKCCIYKNGKKVKEKRAHYNYNLHRIKDTLSEKGFQLWEKEGDWTFKDKYNNEIHDDHIFVRGLTYESSGIIESNLSDHNVIWAEAKLED